jgi:serine/threonine-protein kinase
VVREGDSGNEAFAIVSGRCAVSVMSGGKRKVLRELGPGEVFGEAAVFSDEPRTATVEALEPLEVRVVTGETLSQTLGLQTWAGAFVRALADRFRDADRRARDRGADDDARRERAESQDG